MKVKKKNKRSQQYMLCWKETHEFLPQLINLTVNKERCGSFLKILYYWLMSQLPLLGMNSLHHFCIRQQQQKKKEKKREKESIKEKTKSRRFSRNPKNPPLIPDAYSSLYTPISSRVGICRSKPHSLSLGLLI